MRNGSAGLDQIMMDCCRVLLLRREVREGLESGPRTLQAEPIVMLGNDYYAFGVGPKVL
jgi:hypothetical protein